MSLINKMLQDLEARQELSTAPAQVYKDLQPVGNGGRRSAWHVPGILALVLALGAGAYFGTERMGIAVRSAKTVTPPRVQLPEAAPPVVAQSSTLAVPGGAPPRSELPTRELSAPAARASIEPASPVAAVATPAAKPEKAAAVKPAQASPRREHSQKKAQMRIVKAEETGRRPKSTAMQKPPAARAPQRAAVEVPAVERAATVAVDKKPRPFTATEQAEAAYRRALRFMDQGRPDDAMDELRLALREQPSHVPARELAAGLALQGGHWREAQALLEEGLRQVPSHYMFARLLARVYVDHGAEAKALAVMESAAPQGSDDPEFSALLGLLYQRAGRHADAVQVYKRALTLRPNDARTWLGFAISLEGTGQRDAARRAYQRAKETGGLTPTLVQYADQRLAALAEH